MFYSMADSGSGDDEKTPPPRGGGGEFTKEPTGEEIDQSNLGPESQEHISLDQFGQFSQNELLAGMSQHLQPDMNQLLSQQQAELGNLDKTELSMPRHKLFISRLPTSFV